jgi:tetratricopeptide (TPR) repeat protein
MKKILSIVLFIVMCNNVQSQTREERNELKSVQDRIQKMENENNELRRSIERIEYINLSMQKTYDNLAIQYQHTNDRLNGYLTYTTLISSIFGVLIALAGIYIGFESLRSQNRSKDAIRTLEEAKAYVNGRKSEFDEIVHDKNRLLQEEYDKITKLLKDKLISDIEIETSKVREIAEKKTEEIQGYSVSDQNNKTIELLEKRLVFFENISIPDDPEILFSKMKILREKGMHREAIVLLEKLIERVPNHNEAFWYLGYEYRRIEDIANSIKYYKKHLEINPNDSSALNNISLSYKDKGKMLDALEALNKAISLSDKEVYYTNRIDVLVRLDSNDKAIEDYIKLVSINPSKEGYYNGLIGLLKNEGRDSDVIIYFDKAVNHFAKDNADMANAFEYSKALFLGDKGKEQTAIDILQKLIDGNYKIENCYVEIARLKNKLGRTDEAKNILNAGISKNPLSSLLYIFKAFIESGERESNAKSTIDIGGAAIATENYYFTGGRFFNRNEKFELSRYCYEGALLVNKKKLLTDEIEEGDLMNYYETSIILQKPLIEFNERYRKLIVSERYVIILSVLDILMQLFDSYTEESKGKALRDIKKLNIEAKSKDIVRWDFDDIYLFIEKHKGDELARFTSKVIRYLKRELKFNDL